MLDLYFEYATWNHLRLIWFFQNRFVACGSRLIPIFHTIQVTAKKRKDKLKSSIDYTQEQK